MLNHIPLFRHRVKIMGYHGNTIKQNHVTIKDLIENYSELETYFFIVYMLPNNLFIRQCLVFSIKSYLY